MKISGVTQVTRLSRHLREQPVLRATWRCIVLAARWLTPRLRRIVLASGGRARVVLSARPRLSAGLVALLVLLALLPMMHALTPGGSPALLVTGAPRPTLGATATPLPAGTPDPHRLDWLQALHAARERAYVDGIIAHMTVDQEIGQMLMIEFADAQMTPTIAAELRQFHIGSVVLYKWNISGADGLRQLDEQLQANADSIPLLIATDQEGGLVNRLQPLDGSLPSAEEIGARKDPAFAYTRGQQDGQRLYDLGINMNMAPVADVQALPDSQTYMATRMFGTTPDTVTTLAGAYLSGLQSGHHVAGTLKHFPGLGSVAGDPHQVSVTLSGSLDQLEQRDWAPYRALLATGQVEIIMTTHLTVPAVDPTTPTTLSYPVTTGILRNTLGYQGVIITDGIYMKALAANYTFDQIVVGAVLAGNDIVCSTYSFSSTQEAFRVLQHAVATGTISKQRVDDSVRRILLLKLHYGLLASPPAPQH